MNCGTTIHGKRADDPLDIGEFPFLRRRCPQTCPFLERGEKARLALAKLMMKNANLLVLDEPTNHLDLESKEVLESALIDYPGTILFVSHDRYFMNRIATKVLELDSTGVTEYLGDYDYYVEKKLEQEELAKFKAAQEKKEQAGQRAALPMKNRRKPEDWSGRDSGGCRKLNT